MDSSRRAGAHGIANDTGTGTENGGKGGIEDLKEEVRSEAGGMKATRVKATEGMKVTEAATRGDRRPAHSLIPGTGGARP